MFFSWLVINLHPSRLYQRGSQEKVEKLRCILHYFDRITQKGKIRFISPFLLLLMINLVPNGVITFRRFVLPKEEYPDWSHSNAPLSKVHLTTEKRIEDINCALQVTSLIDICRE